MLAIGFVAMMALPVAYRVWLICHPQPEVERSSLTRFLEKSAEERVIRLLKTPIERWTEYDKRTEPHVFAWQTKHGRTILPWDWTEEARRKDPNGFDRLWCSLFAECDMELREQSKQLRKNIKALDRKVRIEDTIYAHDTNQLAQIDQRLKTNTFPMRIQVQRLTKGRFWGWNTKIESLIFTNKTEVCDEINGRGWLMEECKKISQHRVALLKDKSELASCDKLLLDISQRQDVVNVIVKKIKNGEARSDRDLEVALSKLIKKEVVKWEARSCTK